MEPIEKTLKHIEDGDNILLTGGAGVGKSYNLRKILEWADEHDLNVARTALTGMASLQFEMGETLHRCLGLGFAKNKEDYYRVIDSHKFQTEKLYELQVLDLLIIDEVSMLRSDTLELIDMIFQYVFKNKKPFGGLQVIFSGDFMQLSPIVKKEEKIDFKERGFWPFQSPVWKSLDLKIVYLTEIKRQEDPGFARALNFVRAGVINPDISRYFAGTSSHSEKFPDDVEPVRLLSTNKEVDLVNGFKLGELKTEKESYHARITGVTEKYEEQLKKDCLAMESLELKTGSQVMIIVNSSNGEYVNGSMGEYVGVVEKDVQVSAFEIKRMKFLIVRLFENDMEVHIPKYEWKIEKLGKNGLHKKASFIQFPVKLGWAITVHKSQGMSLDYLKVDLGKCFADGMAYVALSRARSYEGLEVSNWRPGAVKYNKDAFNFYMGLKKSGEI